MHLRLGTLDSLLERPGVRRLALRSPWMLSAAALHRAGLHALAGGAWAEADALLERAAERYREDLRVVPLARLRVHQLMARARAAGADDRAQHLCLQVERALAKLDRIESPEAPFEMVEARSMLATWTRRPDPGEASDVDDRWDGRASPIAA